MTAGRLHDLTNDHTLRRNVGLNLAGWAMPAITALVCIPILARGLGVARFGLVGVTWAAIGIFSLFDFGLGRALTRMVAERLARDDEREIGDLVWTTGWLLLGLTAILSITGLVLAPYLVDRFLNVPADLRAEAVGVVQLLAISIPPLTHGVALRGVLEAGQRFARVNQLRIPLGIVSYGGPLLALPFGGDARIAVGVIVLARIAYWLAHFPFLADVSRGISRPRWPTSAALSEVARVGGWITVSNVISPIIVQADRVAVAVALPIAASGWYGAAAEVATKQMLFTAALGPVLFAALSAALASAPGRAAELAESGARVTLLALLPVAAILAAFAEPGLRWWLGDAYIPEAAAVLRWLAIAVYANTAGQIAYAMLQSGVDARGAAIVHLVELPIYIATLVFAVRRFGMEGVALVWLGRMALDTIVMWAVVYLRMPIARPSVRRIAGIGAVCWGVVAIAAAWGLAR